MGKKNDGGPAVLRFKARLLEDADAGASLNVSLSVGEQLRGMTKVEGTINGHPFRASLDRNVSGRLTLRVNSAMQRGARARAGDTVELAILGPESKLVVPSDLREALAASTDAQTLWKDLTPLGRRDWVRWIEGAKTAETRARRITRTVEQLADGKRRPCCVNVYEFMLSRIEKE